MEQLECWCGNCYCMRTPLMGDVFPAATEIDNTCPKHVFKSLDRAFRLPIRLGMISCAHV
ncbi:hypothetical protein Hanom_Chr02g00148271 [Helianthus anomalus]